MNPQMKFDISLANCAKLVNDLALFEREGFITRDCSPIMARYIYSYALWLKAIHANGLSISSNKNTIELLAKAVPSITEIDLSHSLVFNDECKLEWDYLWETHLFQYKKPHLWNQFLTLKSKWYEELLS